jgi:hypothetical protein
MEEPRKGNGLSLTQGRLRRPFERPRESDRGNKQALWLTLIVDFNRCCGGSGSREVRDYVRFAVASVWVDPRFDLRSSNSRANQDKCLLHCSLLHLLESNPLARTLIKEKSGKLLCDIAHIVSGGMACNANGIARIDGYPIQRIKVAR